MRLVVLTTETTHHAYFIRELGRVFPITRVFAEEHVHKPPFETNHAFEATREEFERDRWFDGAQARLSDFAEVERVPTMNHPSAIEKLSKCEPEAVVVFGTGKLSPEVIAIRPDHTVNLHGGDPEEYRGLDTQLWAIYHRDFAGLIATLHRVSPELDSGEIISQAPVALRRHMKLLELRQCNTETCVSLTLDALDGLRQNGHFASRPQVKLGRYYSAMPTVIKDQCAKRFEHYTMGL